MPVVMVVLAHVLVMVAALNLGHIRVGRGRNADPSIRRDVGWIWEVVGSVLPRCLH